MNRRKLLQLSMMAALATSNQLRAGPVRSNSTKKGLGATPKNGACSSKPAQLHCDWFYTWGPSAPTGIPPGVSFVPMIWGHPGGMDKIAQIGAVAKAAGARELLGFNEPDGKKQANIPVDKALDLWHLLVDTGLRVGSPACVQPDREWMKAFMSGARKRALKVDFVCVHSYGSANAEAFVKRLHEIHKLYDKPIWITEFAVGDWAAKTAAENRYRPSDVLRFMETVLREISRMDFVERYAWFPAKPDNHALGPSALFDEAGKLTRLGECYRDA